MINTWRGSNPEEYENKRYTISRLDVFWWVPFGFHLSPFVLGISLTIYSMSCACLPDTATGQSHSGQQVRNIRRQDIQGTGSHSSWYPKCYPGTGLRCTLDGHRHCLAWQSAAPSSWIGQSKCCESGVWWMLLAKLPNRSLALHTLIAHVHVRREVTNK